MKKELFFYETEKGRVPFRKWLSKLKDRKGKALIQVHMDRLLLGYYGDSKHIKEGVYELKIHYGPSYRLYFGEIKNNQVILLLLGGNKRTQDKDILTALKYWHVFKERYAHE